ncbi:uncharacterized protein [Dermacentor albipictus]|uniref:uncharacterized protein n=1 Tax=Dermacentor albipictus TaxID=60249 RepID=UPI0038FD32F1
MELFRAALTWFSAKWPEREPYIVEVLKCIRFCNMPVVDVLECMDQCVLPELSAKAEVRRMLDGAICCILSKNSAEECNFKEYKQDERSFLILDGPREQSYIGSYSSDRSSLAGSWSPPSERSQPVGLAHDGLFLEPQNIGSPPAWPRHAPSPGDYLNEVPLAQPPNDVEGRLPDYNKSYFGSHTSDRSSLAGIKPPSSRRSQPVGLALDGVFQERQNTGSPPAWPHHAPPPASPNDDHNEVPLASPPSDIEGQPPDYNESYFGSPTSDRSSLAGIKPPSSRRSQPVGLVQDGVFLESQNIGSPLARPHHLPSPASPSDDHIEGPLASPPSDVEGQPPDYNKALSVNEVSSSAWSNYDTHRPAHSVQAARPSRTGRGILLRRRRNDTAQPASARYAPLPGSSSDDDGGVSPKFLSPKFLPTIDEQPTACYEANCVL